MALHATSTVAKHGVEVGQKSTGKARRRQKMRAVRTNGVKPLFCCPPHALFCISIHRGSLARAPPGQRRLQGRRVQQHDGSETSPNPGLAAPRCQATSHARSAPCPGESQSFQRSGQLAVTPGVLIHAAPKAVKPQGHFGMLPRKSAAATSAHVVPGGKQEHPARPMHKRRCTEREGIASAWGPGTLRGRWHRRRAPTLRAGWGLIQRLQNQATAGHPEIPESGNLSEQLTGIMATERL